MDLPDLGVPVHYLSYGTRGGEYAGTCRTAVVTDPMPAGAGGEVGAVSLFVMDPTGVFLHQHVPFDGDRARGGTWHWSHPTLR